MTTCVYAICQVSTFVTLLELSHSCLANVKQHVLNSLAQIAPLVAVYQRRVPCVYLAIALTSTQPRPCHPYSCGSRMLKGFHDLVSMIRAGTALASSIRTNGGWPSASGVNNSACIRGNDERAHSSHSRLTCRHPRPPRRGRSRLCSPPPTAQSHSRILPACRASCQPTLVSLNSTTNKHKKLGDSIMKTTYIRFLRKTAFGLIAAVVLPVPVFADLCRNPNVKIINGKNTAWR